MDRRAGCHEDRGRPHDVAIAVPIGVAVEASQGPFRIGARRRLDGFDPAGPRLIVEYGGEGKAGPFGFGDGTDAVIAQLRHQRQKHPRGRYRVAEGGMPVGDFDPEPGGELLQRIAGQFRCGDLRQQPRVERARPRPRQAGEIAFALQHGKVEADRVPDHHGLAEKRVEARPDFREQRRFGDHGIVDAMNARRLGGNRFTGRPQQLAELFAGNQLSSREPHRRQARSPAPCVDRARWFRYR